MSIYTNADRYEWLRSEEVSTNPIYYPFWDEFHAKLCRLDRMDALIDKWMECVPEDGEDDELTGTNGPLGVGA